MADSAPAPAAATAGSSEAKQGERPELELWQDQLRGWLATIAVLVAQSSLQSALSPPGGFWQDDQNGHVAGNPILADRFAVRYRVFFYLSTVAFATSLAVVVMVTKKDVLKDTPRLVMLCAFMVVDLLALMGVYAAGTCRDMQSTVVVSVLMGLVFLQIVFMLRFANVVVVRAWKCLKDMYKCFGQKYEPPVSAPSGGQRA